MNENAIAMQKIIAISHFRGVFSGSIVDSFVHHPIKKIIFMGLERYCPDLHYFGSILGNR
jgi:hypothetical protein